MKSYWMFYIPAVIFFTLPVVNILYQSAKANAAAKAREAKRRAAAELKRIEQASRPKRKPGRPRKNQEI